MPTETVPESNDIETVAPARVGDTRATLRPYRVRSSWSEFRSEDSCNDTRFVLPGDIETAGWEKLLEKEAFRALLRGVDYFVASHHGREDGYCADVFKYCSPKAVIFSDGPIRHATQEMANTYAKHATGISFNNESRKVLSTRKDGSLNWNHL